MSQKKPYHRNYREMKKWTNSWYSWWAYIIDKEYAQSPEHYIRSFLILLDDLKKIFEYIEPSDINLSTYWYRIHSLFMRVCIEVEANFKAIFKENIYSKNEKDRNINDYKKIDKTHHLSSYTIILPVRDWNENNIQPFLDWKSWNSLERFKSYNDSKHDRQWKFKKANFKNLIYSISGLIVLLSSQFKDENFSSWPRSLEISWHDYFWWESTIWDYFRILFPNDWEENEKYDFDRSILKLEDQRLEKINYDLI